MMSKSKTPPSRRLRVLWALPLVCLAIGLQARTIYVPAGEDTPQEGVQVSPQTVIVLKVAQDGRITVDGREIPQNELAEFLRSQGTPVSSLVVEVDADENTPKEILVKFYDGLRNAGVMKVQVKAVLVKPEEGDRFLFIRREAWGEEKEMSMEEAWEIEPSRVRSIDVLEYADAKEKYGEKAINGVRIFNMKRPQELDEIVVVSYAEEDDGPIPFILADPDTLPRFQGEGMDAFSRWLNVRIRRPKGCTHAGDMKVSFTVATDGSVQDIKVTKSVCESLDAMVVSLIGQSPKWEPATAGGHPVAQCLTIPITFKMR